MKIASIKRFDGGIADDYVRGAPGQCSVCKHFDISTFPFRLQPLRGMTNSGEITDSMLMNMILGANGTMYGIGTDPNNPTFGELYKRTGYGASDFWKDFTTDQLSGSVLTESSGHADFLVHFPEMTPVRKLFWSSLNNIMASDPADAGSSADTDSLTFQTIGQGLVHPKDTTLYFPYQTTTATYIGKISVHATDPFGTVNYTAFTAPNRYRAYCLSFLGDDLAIPLTIDGISGTSQQSIVVLWDRDTSTTNPDDVIPWGSGTLKVLNNLNGALIGVSVLSGESSEGSQDVDKIQIKAYEGGAEPQLIKEIVANRVTSTSPSCVINHRVNFIHNNRLYFSANVINGDSDANYYGLWSVGKNKLGEWTVCIERMATNDGTETGVIAAAFFGDFLSCVHTSNGTLTYTTNGNTLSTIYGATSVYESVINPEMEEGDKCRKKKFLGIYATMLPMPAAGQIVVKYRVDSNKDDSWTTLKTETTDDGVRIDTRYDDNGSQIGPEFTNIEFRIESTGGATITEFGYAYDLVPSQIFQ